MVKRLLLFLFICLSFLSFFFFFCERRILLVPVLMLNCPKLLVKDISMRMGQL